MKKWTIISAAIINFCIISGLVDTINSLYERIWKLEERNKNKLVKVWSDLSDVEEYKRLKIQLDELIMKRDELIKRLVKD